MEPPKFVMAIKLKTYDKHQKDFWRYFYLKSYFVKNFIGPIHTFFTGPECRKWKFFKNDQSPSLNAAISWLQT